MQKKIVVPTDFSANSKAGVRFAIQLASQSNSTLVFYHCAELLKPVSWSNVQFKTYVKNQLNKRTAELVTFVDKCYEQIGGTKGKFECVVERGIDPKKSLVKYAVGVKAKAICMGTRGAGKIKKMIGTNSSGVLATSPVPVFVIPKSYQMAPITSIMYASDLDHLKSEIRRMREFTAPIKRELHVYHYTAELNDPETHKKLMAIQSKHSEPDVTFTFDTFHNQPFAVKFEKDLKKSKASLGVLFTNQKRNWFERLFRGSNAAELSFTSKIPILVFAKD